MPQITKFGSEFLINTTTTNSQSFPAIAALSANSFLATWTDSSGVGGDESDTGVKAQLWNIGAEGLPMKVGREFLVNAQTFAFQNGAEIITLSPTTFLITWNDQRGDQGGDGVKAQLWSTAGDSTPMKVGGEFLVNTVTERSQSSPDIALLSPTSFVVTWEDSSGIGGDASISAIKAQVWSTTSGGTPAKVGSEFLVNTASEGDQREPAVTALSETSFLVTWTDPSGVGGDSSGTGIKAQLWSTLGGDTPTKIGDEFRVNRLIPGFQFDSEVTALSPTSFITTWTEGFLDNSGLGVWGQLWSTIAGGTPVRIGSDFQVNTVTSGDQDDATVVALSASSFLITWTDSSGAGEDTTGSGIKAQFYSFDDNGAVKVSGEFLVNTETAGSQVFSAVTKLSANSLVVAWTDLSGTGGDASASSIKAQILLTNEAPVIVSDGGGTTAAVSVTENRTAVTLVQANDADAGATLTYALVGGADAALFNIDAATGALTFAAAPDFEAPSDAGANNDYEVVVSASDGTRSDTQALAVTVTNANEAPVITSNGGGATALVDVIENGTAVMTVAASDPDAGTTLTYAIAGGADAGRFAINAATGALSFISAPNFEAPTDAGSDNLYEVIVSASDGSLTDTQALGITVSNVVDEGTAGNDSLIGTAAGDLIHGLGGGDTLLGLDGADTLDGGSGNDLLAGGSGTDVLYAGDGSDTAYGDDGADFLDMGAGDDLAFGGTGLNTLLGGEGRDVLVGGADAEVLAGGTGDDTLYGSGGNDTAYGDDGADLLDLGGGDDLAFGGAGINVLLGGDGRDTLIGGVEADVLAGGAGADTLYGNDGNDTGYGDDGDDVLDLGAGNDFLSDTSGSNTLLGAGGDDFVVAGAGADLLVGGDGNDTLYGNEGNDTGYGDAGDDRLDLGAGDDLLSDGSGNNVLLGGEGRDSLFAGAGNDTLAGGAGDDLLGGGGGNDALYGDDGLDRFFYVKGDGAIGRDIIDGGAGDDVVSFYGYARADAAVSTAGATTTVAFADGSSVQVTSVARLGFDDGSVFL